METPNLSFTREPISQWENIWLLAATADYDIIGGGITILEDRTKDATGTPLVTFTTPHIAFRHSLLVRAEDAERIQNYTDLTRDVRVGVLRGTTGEARLLQITGIVDANGVVAAGTRIDTPTGTVVADGTADYKITAAGSTPNIENRFTLYPSADSMPQVNYPVNMPNEGFDPLIPRITIPQQKIKCCLETYKKTGLMHLHAVKSATEMLRLHLLELSLLLLSMNM